MMKQPLSELRIEPSGVFESDDFEFTPLYSSYRRSLF